MLRYLYFCWCLVFAALIFAEDLKTQLIPDRWLLLLCCGIFMDHAAVGHGGAVCLLLLWLLYLQAVLICTIMNADVPIGMGDIKLFTAIILLEGTDGFIFSALLSSFLCGICCVFLLGSKKIKKTDRIAYGPFITFSFVLYLTFRIFAPEILMRFMLFRCS